MISSINQNQSSATITSKDKFEAWNDNKRKLLRDTVLKVAAIVALVLFGAANLASIFVAPVIFPVTFAAVSSSASAILGISGGTGWLIGMGGAAVLGILSDWTNYRDPKVASNELFKLKTAKVPLSISKYQQLHRYGIISKEELQKRRQLEGDCRKYQRTQSKIDSIQGKIDQKQRKIDRIKEMSSMNTRKKVLEKEIEELNKEKQPLEENKARFLKRFADFHESIVDFDPKASA